MPHTIRRNSGCARRKIDKGPQQAIQILVRVQRRSGQQKLLGPPPLANARELRIHAVRNHANLRLRRAWIEPQHVGAQWRPKPRSAAATAWPTNRGRIARMADRTSENTRDAASCCISWKTVVCGHGQKNGAVKPGLSIASSRKCAAASGKTVCSQIKRAGRKDAGTPCGMRGEVRRLGHQVRARFAIGEDEIAIDRVDRRQRLQAARAGRFPFRPRRRESGRAR